MKHRKNRWDRKTLNDDDDVFLEIEERLAYAFLDGGFQLYLFIWEICVLQKCLFPG